MHANTAEIRSQERVEEVRSVISIGILKMAIPLFFVFWFCDLIYRPDLKWQFLALRATIIPLSALGLMARSRIKSAMQAQLLCAFYAISVALPISIMIYEDGGGRSPYYAGLNLVCLGAGTFFPLTLGYWFFTVLGIFLPYLIICFLTSSNLTWISVHTFFIVSTAIISFLIRFFNESLRVKELESRLALKAEIVGRDEVIARKSKEAIRLASLSNQFSPQIVEAIRQEKIDLGLKVHRSQLCAIFIDIVNSTEKVTSLDQNDVDKVISQFMEDTFKSLLKHDITIDKFLGDGVLAFCNDPVQYPDYVERVLRAAIEIRARIKSNQAFYFTHWADELKVRVGIATSSANVGFYGNRAHFKSYTAIGPVINLANRVCSSADPNEILITELTYDKILSSDEFSISFVEKRKFKGFENESIGVFRVDGLKKTAESSMAQDVDCPSCHSIMHIETNNAGIYIFKCRNCGHILSGQNTNASKKKIA